MEEIDHKNAALKRSSKVLRLLIGAVLDRTGFFRGCLGRSTSDIPSG